MRFLNPGPPRVLKAVLDGRESYPTDTELKIQPGFETRALRPWEYFHEGIVLIQTRQFIAGVAGQFSGWWYAAFLPFDLIIIESVLNLSGQSVEVRYGSTPAGVAGNPWLARDTRWGVTPLNGGVGSGGSVAAPDGQIVGVLASGIWNDLDFVIQHDFTGVAPFTPNPTIGFIGVTVNTGVSLVVKAKAVRYRMRP